MPAFSLSLLTYFDTLSDFLTRWNTRLSGLSSVRGGNNDCAISLSGIMAGRFVFRCMMLIVGTPSIILISHHLRCCISPRRRAVMDDKPNASCTVRSFSHSASTARKRVSSSGVRYSLCLSGAWKRSNLFRLCTGLNFTSPSRIALLNIALTVSSNNSNV